MDIKKSWIRIKGAAGIKGKTIHDLRRTLGTWMISNGESLDMIGKILNHSNPKVTADHYGHLIDRPAREALNRHANKVLSIR